jgi:hypothetical protein
MIILTHGYAIDADAAQFILGVPVKRFVNNKKTGEKEETTVMNNATYHSTLSQALGRYRRALQRDMVHCQTIELNALLAAVTALDRHIKDALPEYEFVKAEDATEKGATE